MATTASNQSAGRAAALARRKALSAQGKQGLGPAGRKASRTPERVTPKAVPAPAPAAVAAPAAPSPARRNQGPIAVNGGRTLAMARRAALAGAGKPAAGRSDRTRAAEVRANGAKPEAKAKGDCGCGCGGKRDQSGKPANPPETKLTGLVLGDRGRGAQNGTKPRASAGKPSGRMVALARRSALSGRGKGAVNASNPSAATLARQANPKLTSRELAQQVRTLRSRNGGNGNGRRSAPAGRVRPNRGEKREGAEDASWKVGASATASGGRVTGTQVGRTGATTGNEYGTCRTVTGTEYLGAEIFQEFCQAEAPRNPAKVSLTSTSHGRTVTGTRTGRSGKVTGDEPGTCKSVTGTEYLSVEDQDAFCGVTPAPNPLRVGVVGTVGGRRVSGIQVGRSDKVTGDEPGSGRQLTGTQYTSPAPGQAPPKVGTSVTLRGGAVTGTRVGRSERVTGDEPGSCRLVTGDEYTDRGQYQQFCGIEAPPEAPKVGHSETLRRKVVSGTQTGRSGKVTGDEPGTCKTVTGTPYAGLEQYQAYCGPEVSREAVSRIPPMGAPRLTGLQPGINGVMTGAERGACSSVTGTPYTGGDQFAAACSNYAADPGAGDYPRALDGGAPGQGFSVMSPARQVFQARNAASAVTGTRYEQGQITGPFGMGTGKVTGTEQFRFDQRGLPQGNLLLPDKQGEPVAEGTPAPRITGEGQSSGLKITGDDWARGERVTGTEGASAKRRNPTRPGPMSAMAPVQPKRNEEVEAPTSRVTGSSGSTERGALVTYSGGARG